MRRYWQTYSIDPDVVERVLDYCVEQSIPHCIISQTNAYTTESLCIITTSE